jgi:hypothetical protein
MLRAMNCEPVMLLARGLRPGLLVCLMAVTPALSGCAILGVGAAVIAADASTSTGDSEKSPTTKVRPPEAAR